MVWNKLVSDEEIIKSYQKTNSVWKTAKEVGLCGQSVHERLKSLGLNNHRRIFTEEEKKELKKVYEKGFLYGDKDLKELSKKLNRTVPFLSRQAKMMGLTNNHRKRNKNVCTEIGKRTKLWIKENGHPKGMLGKKHTQEMKDNMSKNSKKWARYCKNYNK